MTHPKHAIVSAREEGPTYWTGFPNTVRVSGEDTGGALTVIEMRVPPGFEGPPHVHHNEHQTDHVVEGELVFTVGDETIVAESGTIVHCPKDVPHSFRNDSEAEAIVYDWLHPAGFDEFMARAAPQVTDPSDPPELDMNRAMELAPEYGLEFITPHSPDPDGGSERS
jgi:quercetin dioxygenase-like cupin family protein